MLLTSNRKIFKTLSLLTVIGISSWLLAKSPTVDFDEQTQSYIISANQYELLREKIAALNVTPSHELGIINALAVELTATQLALLQQQLDVKVTVNHKVSLSAKSSAARKNQPKSVINDLIDVSAIHQGTEVKSANYGEGISIAFLDTGLEYLPGLAENKEGWQRFCYTDFCGAYDATTNQFSTTPHEESGHGTHVASIAVNSQRDANGNVYGIAPDAGLLGIKAFDSEGKASYADVIRGIGWAVEVKDKYNLRVLNMSFSGQVRSSYWDDPLNQAVMRAWSEGIVVVASAGNLGPDPMTVGVPGNVPYIITVGAMTGSKTLTDLTDDKLADFSSAGPTVEGFVKPDLVAPGGNIVGLMSKTSQLALAHPDNRITGRYFEMSGTSQATAVVSGIVALMLKDNPALTPDEVKCRLMSSAHSAVNADDALSYSLFQQGTGLVNAKDAINSKATLCANQNMDIASDLAGEMHYYGPAKTDNVGDIHIDGLGDEYVWDVSQKTVSDQTISWKNTKTVDADVFVWEISAIADDSNSIGIMADNKFKSDVFIWKNFFESDVFIWKNSFDKNIVVSDTAVDFNDNVGISVNSWVETQ